MNRNPQITDLQLTEPAANGGAHQNDPKEGNGGVNRNPQITDLQLTEPAANGGAHQNDPKEGNGGVNRADPIKTYEEELSNAWRWACIIGSLHACSQFVAFCNLTWATVVLLGAFVPDLLPLDFDFVVCLLLLEGARLSSASFFTRLLCRALAYLSQDPKRINHGQDDQYPRAEWARFCSQLLQVVFIAPGVIMSAIRVFSKLDYYEFNGVRNVQKSLRIFYASVFFNCLVALLNLVCSAIAAFALRRTFPTEQSILRYFDKVLENAMGGFGVVQADNFDFFHFAFSMLASEFRRNVQPEAVAKNHKQLIRYMYAHRLGVDFVQINLNAEDAFLQLAAVNIVGFWADRVWDVGVPKLRLPEELLTELADKVGTGQVGWAATTSFGAIAASSPEGAEIVERTCTTRGVRLPDRLADLVDAYSSRSLSPVRTLVIVYEQSCKGKGEAPMAYGSNLVAKLEILAEGAERHRLRVQAAYLLHLMNKRCDASVIRSIDPTKDKYWFRSEKRMLQLLRRVIKAPAFQFGLHPVIREDHTNVAPPPWAEATELEEHDPN